MDSKRPSCRPAWAGGLLRSRTGIALLAFLIALLAFLAVAGFSLLAEHTAHVLGVLPFALLLLCPLLHLFLHRGHGSDHGAHSRLPGGGKA